MYGNNFFDCGGHGFHDSSTLVSAAAGGLDNTLDGNGKLATDFNGSTDLATDVLIHPATCEWFIVRSEDSSFYGFPFWH